MKKNLLLIIALFFISNIVTAQYVTIPDNNFRTFLQNKYPGSFNGSNMMDTTSGAIVNETKLEIGELGINNLTGIQYFKSLTYLDCSMNGGLTSMPPLSNSLTYLDCSFNNSDTSFPVFPPSLTYLDISDNNSLTTFPAFPNSLTYLDCHDDVSITNAFSSLPTSLVHLDCSELDILTLPALPTSLKYLNCSEDGQFHTLPALPNLDTLICSNNFSISALPLLPSTLIYLDCSQNRITGSLQSLPATLTFLNCSDNQFTGSVPSLPATIDTFYCSGNQFTSLPTLPVSLTTLHCDHNPLGSLPALPNGLTELFCHSDQLSVLPTLPNSLITLICESNQLTSLPVLPQSLSVISCDINQISSLPVLPPNLTQLLCSYNTITALPTLPNTIYRIDCSNNSITNLPARLPSSLQMLDCSKNQLSNLPVLPNPLNQLDCHGNNIYCLPQLPNNLFQLVLDGSKIQCLPNKGPYLSVQNEDSIGQEPLTISLCTPANINNCHNFPVLSGIAFYDNNSNGVQDAGELYKSYLPILLSNGSYTYTNSNGYYEIAITDSLGHYTLSANTPEYYKASPDSVNYDLINYDTTLTQNFAMQPTANVDSLTINMFAFHNFARPGGQLPFIINYANVGTTTLSPMIVFKYDNSLLTYDSSSNSAVINNGDSLSLAVSSFVPGQSGSFMVYFDVKTSATLGDTSRSKVSIAANSAIAVDSIRNIVSTSYDPNGKDATPQLTPQDVANGKYINYTIHFQNTGNDTAFHIMVADTLSNLLQATSLQINSSSKPCKITLKGNVITFDFENILLPDSIINPLGSIGFVSFNVKPVSSVTEGTVINNVASIYFDYNTPVVTNTATTLIQSIIVKQAPVVTDSVLQGVNDVVVNNPAENSLTVKVNNSSLNNTSADIYNSQGSYVKSIVLHGGTQTIDVSNLSSGAYYLKTQTATLKVIIVR